MRRTYVLAAAFTVAVTAPAAAQPREPRVFLGIGVGSQPAPGDLSGRFEFEENRETATVNVEYPSKSSVAFDGGVGVRLWKQMGLGVTVSRFERDGPATITGRIPHPFFFDEPRDISGEDEVTRAETGIHGQVLFIVPTSGRFRMILSAGPSRIEAEQDLVTAVQYSEEFPFDTAAFRSATTRTFKGSKVGFNAGADLALMLTRAIGVGAAVRYSRASFDLGPEDNRVSVEAGGLQAGGGLRFVF